MKDKKNKRSILDQLGDYLNLSTKEINSYILTLILFFYCCFPYALISVVLITFTVLVTFFNHKNIKARYKKEHLTAFFSLTLWLLVLYGTIVYSENKNFGFKLIQRYINIFLLAFVFIFVFPSNILKKKHFLFLAFIMANVVFSLIMYYKAILVIEKTCYPQIYYSSYVEKILFLFKKPNHIIFSCFENEYEHSFFIHRVYNSMSFLFSIILIIELFFFKKFNKKKIFILFGSMASLWFLFLIFYQFSVVNVFLTFLLCPLFLIFKIKSSTNIKINLKHILGVFIGVILLPLLISKSSVATKQLQPVINLVEKVISGTSMGNVDERYEINKASKNLILEAPVFGYGIGDVQDKLNDFYKEKINESPAYKKIYENQLNSHNNYAFLGLAGGIIVFMLFVFSQFFLIRISILDKNWVYFFFIILFAFNLMFENMLSRVHGVVFYTLFNSLFLAQHLQNKKY